MREKVRVRFAPSPTGPLHIGSARTALFNYLYAKKFNGVFVLRFEDTDTARSQKVFEENILGGLAWLGFVTDETYHQSEREKVYRSYLQKLTDRGLTYEHDGGVYFKLPTDNRKVIVDDIIRGQVEFESKDFDDLVLFKKDGSPTFHFANVVDDIEMKITHVIRGEDHLSNTPKHILLYEALDATPPQFAHIPLILNPDRTKMSKRAGNVNLDDYKQAGYLPEALINFLVQLGWSDPSSSVIPAKAGIYSLDELIKLFDLSRVQKAGAVFDIKHLNHLNHYYLMQKPLDEYTALATSRLSQLATRNSRLLRSALRLVQDRAQTLGEIPSLIEFFFTQPEYDSPLLVFKKSSPEQTMTGLKTALKVLEAISETEWAQPKLQQILDEATAAESLQPGDLFWPVRVALSGRDASPSPTELLDALGKTESIARIKTAINKLGN
ncbi:MAG: glutamate--tRNA ligase [Patescibacteria group bacterium]